MSGLSTKNNAIRNKQALQKTLLITLRSDIGGGPKHVADLAKFHGSKNLFIAAPSTSPYGPIYKGLAEDFFELPHRRFCPLALLRLLMFCRRNGITLVHSHGRGAGIYSRLLGCFGFRIIHTFHGVHAPKSSREALVVKLERALSYLTNKFISVSNDEAEMATQTGSRGTSSLVVIPNGISVSGERVEYKNKFQYFCTISRLDSHKNNKELIRIFKTLVDKDSSLILNIAGDGEDKTKLESYISELGLNQFVNLIGAIDNPLEFLKGNDVFLSTSLGEGLPYAVLEAMSLKMPILASRVTGHIQLLEEENLFSLGDDMAFFKKIQNLSEEVCNKNFEKVIKDYNAEIQLQKVISEY